MKKKNPRLLAGIGILAVLILLGSILISQMIPTIRETRREMSLTPTPLPPVPGNVMALTPDPAAPTAEPVLRNGARGQDVKDLQSRLAVLGYYDPAQVDGAFGAGTRDAVIAFQKANGLDADGIAGTETKRILFSAQAVPFTGAAQDKDENGGESR